MNAPLHRFVALAAAAVFCFTGCHSTEAVDATLAPGVKSAIIIERAQDFASAQAFSAGDASPDIALRDGVEVTLAQYRCSLDRLGLDSGVQVLLEVPTQRTPLPNPVAAARLSAESLSWQEAPVAESALDVLSRLPVDRSRICETAGTRLTARGFSVELGVPFADVGVVTALGDGTALLSSNAGRFYRVEANGHAEPIELVVADADRAPATAGFFDGAEIWLAATGTVAHGTLEAGFQILPGRAPAIGGHMSLTGESMELFLGDYEHLYRYDGAWQDVSSPMPTACLRPLEPRIAALGAGRALAAVAWSSLHVKDGETSVVDFVAPAQFPNNEEIGTSAAITQVFGPVMGTLLWNPARFAVNGGYLHKLSAEGAFVRLDDTYVDTLISNIAELGGELVVYGGAPGDGANSSITRYHAVVGKCDSEQIAGDIRGMVALDDEHLLVAQSRSPNDANGLRYSVLTRTKPTDDCLLEP
ncbi:MAG: hypothetical protein HY791_17945 [Deltaproteobacteria bacterium]|nr:hypothetical protein [Deltaproteobacteria bacterium]